MEAQGPDAFGGADRILHSCFPFARATRAHEARERAFFIFRAI